MKSIDNTAFLNLYQQEKVTIIDVREVNEFTNGHILGAVNLPLSTLTDTASQLDKNHSYYVICQGGMRSQKACDLLDTLGYKVNNVEGGMNAWSGEVTQ